MSRYMLWYDRADLKHDNFKGTWLYDIMLFNVRLSILVNEELGWEAVPGVKIPSACEGYNRDIKLISQGDNILIALLGESGAISKDKIQLEKYLGYGAIHQAGDILIGTDNIVLALGKQLMIGVEKDPPVGFSLPWVLPGQD